MKEMVNLKEKKFAPKMTSIARKLNASWLFHLIKIFTALNIFFSVISVFAWRIITESKIFSYDIFEFYNHKLKGDFIYSKEGTFLDLIKSVEYVIPDLDKTIQAGDFFLGMLLTSIPLLVLEGFVFISSVGLVNKKIKKNLLPIDQITIKTKNLSNASTFNLHKLEDALGKIDIMSEEDRINTGNHDLIGLEEAINDLIKRMKESYIYQARFVSDASHELRTPISVIQGYANMLDRWGKGDEKILEESINAIKSESEHMKKLVEQLLFLARGDNGKNQMIFESFCISKMIKELYEEYKMVDKKHEYIMDLQDDLFAYGDLSMLKQTARILIDNASKYTSEGDNIILRTKINEKNDVCFEIQDSGIGIEEKDLPHIFNRFFRSDPDRNRNTGGTGLGLSIAKWIVEQHRGYFEILSVLDIGTRITVCLPNFIENEQ